MDINSRTPLHTSPLRASYDMYFVSYNIDNEIKI